MKLNALVFASSLLPAIASYAEPLKERGGYVGAAYGVSSFEDDDAYASEFVDDVNYINSDLDKNGQAWQIYGGYRFIKYFALEGRYTYFGDYSGDFDGVVFFPELNGVDNFQGAIELEFSAFTLHALGIYPFGQSGFDIYGQLGAGILSSESRVNVSFELGSGSVTEDDSATVLSAGAGVRYTPPGFQDLTIQLAYDLYAFEASIGDDYNQSLSMGKLGIQYNF